MFKFIHKYIKTVPLQLNFIEGDKTQQYNYSQDIKKLQNLENDSIDIDENFFDFSDITNILSKISNKIKNSEKISKKELQTLIKTLDNIKNNLNNNGKFSESNEINSYKNKFLKIQKELNNKENEIKNDTHKKVEELKQENSETLSSKAKKIINLMIPENKIDRDTENGGDNKVEKTSSLGESNQVRIILNETLTSDKKILNFFNQISEFEKIKNIDELNKQVNKIGNEKLIKILERYIDPSNGITFATLLENGPKETLKIQINKANQNAEKQNKELEKIETHIEEMQKFVKEAKKEADRVIEKNFELKNGIYYKKIGKNIQFPIEAKQQIIDKIINNSLDKKYGLNIKDRGNLIALFDTKKGFQGLGTNISISEIVKKLNIGEKIEDFFENLGSSVSVSKQNGESPQISLTIAGGNLIAIPLNKNTIFDINGFITNTGIGADTGIKYKTGKYISGISLGANADTKGGFILGPTISISKDINEEINELKENITKDFKKAISDIGKNKNYNKENFSYLTSDDYNNLKEIINIIKQDYPNNKQEKIINSITEEQIIKKLKNKLVGAHFSGVSLSILDPHVAIISFIASLTAGTNLIYKGTKSVSQAEQEKYSKPKKLEFDNTEDFKKELEKNGIRYEDGYLAIPENYKVVGDSNIKYYKNDKYKVISGDIKNIRIEKIIGEGTETSGSELQMLYTPTTEAPIKYKIILNNGNQKIQQTNSLEKANIIPHKEKVISNEYEKYSTTKNISQEFINSLNNLAEISVDTFKNKRNKDLWKALVKGDYDNTLSKYGDKIEKITGIKFENLNYDEKLYLIDYLSSQASRYKRSEKFLQSGKTDIKNFETRYKYQELFEKINNNYLGLENYSSLHNQLLENFKAKNIQTEFVNSLGFTFRSPLDQNGKTPIYQGLGHFNKTVNILKTTENWKDSAVEITSHNNLKKIIDNMSDAQLLEFKRNFGFTESRDKLKNILKQKIDSGEINFKAYLAKDIGLDDTIIIEVEKTKILEQPYYSLEKSVIMEGETPSNELNKLALSGNVIYTKEKKLEKLEEPKLEEPEKPEKPKPPKEPEPPKKPKIQEKSLEVKLPSCDKDKEKKLINAIYEKIGNDDVVSKITIEINNIKLEYKNLEELKKNINKINKKGDVKAVIEFQSKKSIDSYKKNSIKYNQELIQYNQELIQYNNLMERYNNLMKQYNILMEEHKKIKKLIDNKSSGNLIKSTLESYNKLLEQYRQQLNKYKQNYNNNISFIEKLKFPQNFTKNVLN